MKTPKVDQLSIRQFQVLLIVTVFSSFCHGATVYWSGGVGDWDVAGNWSGGSVPGSSDNATIHGFGTTYNVTIDQAVSNINILNVGGNNSPSQTSILNINSGGSLTAGNMDLSRHVVTLNINGGSLTLDNSINTGQAYIGNRNATDNNTTVNLTAGAFTSNKRTNITGDGPVTFNISGGTYTHNDERLTIHNIPTAVTFNHSGGTWQMFNSNYGISAEVNQDIDFNFSGNAVFYGEQNNTSNPLLKIGGVGKTGTKNLHITGSNVDFKTTSLRLRGDGTGTNTIKFTPDSSGVSTVNLVQSGGRFGTLDLSDSADVLEVDFTSYLTRKTALVLFDYANSLTGTFATTNWTGLQSYEDAVLEYDSTNKQIKVTPFGEIIWTGATDGTWSNTGNWDVPVAPDDDLKHKVVFDTSTTGAQTIAIAANRSIAGLDYTGDANHTVTVAASQTLTMGTAAQLSINEAGSGTTFKIDGSGSLKINNTTDAINVQKGTLELDLTLDSTSAALDITGTSNGVVKLTNIGASYSKAITVGETRLQLGSADRIHNSSDLTLNNGAVLDLNNISERINNLSFNNGEIDFGSTAGANIFLIANKGTGSNIIVIRNFEDGTDQFGSVADLSGDTTLLSQIKFLGTGGGAVWDATGFTYDGGTAAGQFREGATVYSTWDGSTDTSWSDNTNWDTGPGAGSATTHVKFTSIVGLSAGTVQLDGGADKTMNTLLFDNTSTAYTITNAGSEKLILGGTLPSVIHQSVNAHTISANLQIDPYTANIDLIVDVSNASGQLTISSVISENTGSHGLLKTGSGKLILSGTNTYTGTTTVAEGSLQIDGSIAGSLNFSGIFLTGSGTIGKDIQMLGGTISAGTETTTGKFIIDNSGDATSVWGAGTYIWNVSGGMSGVGGTDSNGDGYIEVAQAADGSLYDILFFTGALDFTGASADSIIIKVDSNGAYTGYSQPDFTTKAEIKIVEAAGGISNFNESYFKLDTSGFDDAVGSWWLNWKIAHHSNALWLQYEAVPEPGTYAMVGIVGLLPLLAYFRKKKRRLNHEMQKAS